MISGRLENTASAKEIRMDDSTAASQSAPTPPTVQEQGVDVVPKHAKAVQLWLGVMVVVLIGLWLQTRSVEQSYNFLIEGGRDGLGAQVSIDGVPVGTLQQTNAGGVQIVGLHSHVPDGQHRVTVSKPGFKPVTLPFEMRGEDYLNVQLQPQ